MTSILTIANARSAPTNSPSNFQSNSLSNSFAFFRKTDARARVERALLLRLHRHSPGTRDARPIRKRKRHFARVFASFLKRRQKRVSLHLLLLLVRDCNVVASLRVIDMMVPRSIPPLRVVPIFLLAMANRLQRVVLALMAKGFPKNINAPLFPVSTALCFPSYFLLAVALGLASVIKGMLKMKPDFNTSWYHITPLIITCCRGDLQLLTLLVENGANTNTLLPLSHYFLLRSLNAHRRAAVSQALNSSTTHVFSGAYGIGSRSTSGSATPGGAQPTNASQMDSLANTPISTDIATTNTNAYSPSTLDTDPTTTDTAGSDTGTPPNTQQNAITITTTVTEPQPTIKITTVATEPLPAVTLKADAEARPAITIKPATSQPTITIKTEATHPIPSITITSPTQRPTSSSLPSASTTIRSDPPPAADYGLSIKQLGDNSVAHFPQHLIQDNGLLPIELAALAGHADIVKFLLPKTDARLLAASPFALLIQNNLEMTLHLIKCGASLAQKDNFGSTPLHLAARAGKLDQVIALVLAKADVNASGQNGWPPLHEALSRFRKDTVHYLLARGADTTLKNSLGESAADLARRIGFTELEIAAYLSPSSNDAFWKRKEDAVNAAAKLVQVALVASPTHSSSVSSFSAKDSLRKQTSSVKSISPSSTTSVSIMTASAILPIASASTLGSAGAIASASVVSASPIDAFKRKTSEKFAFASFLSRTSNNNNNTTTTSSSLPMASPITPTITISASQSAPTSPFGQIFPQLPTCTIPTAQSPSLSTPSPQSASTSPASGAFSGTSSPISSPILASLAMASTTTASTTTAAQSLHTAPADTDGTAQPDTTESLKQPKLGKRKLFGGRSRVKT